jgi:drug/metabolite transporter (DMT)-like permease
VALLAVSCRAAPARCQSPRPARCVTTAESLAPRRSALTAEGTHRDAFTSVDWALLVGAGFIWGASFLQIDESLRGYSPYAVTFGRILFGCLALAAFPIARTPMPRSAWPQIVAVSVTWLAFPMTLFPIAQQHISSSLAGMLNGGIPMFTAAVATVLLRRAPGRNQLAALGVGAVGLVMIGLPSIGDGGSSALGVVLVVVAIASYGVAVNLSVPLVQAYGPLPVFWRCQLLSVALTAPLGMVGLADSSFGWRPSLFLVSLGVFGTALAFVFMTTLSSRVGATRGSALTYIEAAVALLLGVMLLGESVRPLEVLGCAVILVAAWLAGRADRAA